jgi:hypothetical protein
VAKHCIRRARQSARLSDPTREVLAAWITALFALVVGLFVLAGHEGNVRDDGIAAVVPRWHAPPVTSAEDWDESGWRRYSLMPEQLPVADGAIDPKITQSPGDSISWSSLSNPREGKPSNC